MLVQPNATSQYAITLNASETAYKTHISYEITNSHISSKGRGINITAGTEQETLNEVNGTPHIIISNNAFELPKSSDSNMAVQIAGNWSAANLDSTEDALITISDNTIDAYTAVRIHDSMGKTRVTVQNIWCPFPIILCSTALKLLSLKQAPIAMRCDAGGDQGRLSKCRGRFYYACHQRQPEYHHLVPVQ